MAFVKAASLAALGPNQLLEALIDGTPYALCNVGGQIHALEGTCPHRGGPLGQGAVHEGRVVCPWHAWEFDCATGANDYDPAIRLRKYPVKIQNGDIFIDAG
jgi:nitrite reductase/ring-hydroxylating ferredoxin subunit